jgi:hypothetical protein
MTSIFLHKGVDLGLLRGHRSPAIDERGDSLRAEGIVPRVFDNCMPGATGIYTGTDTIFESVMQSMKIVSVVI